MNIIPVRGLLLVGAFCASVLTAAAQVVEFRATINAAQENNPANTSTASGSAIMHYNFANNTFDLMVSITGMTNLVTGSNIHEGAVGVNGSGVTNLGGETAYTRTGNTLTATFRDVRAGPTASPLLLLQSGAYFNITSAQYPGGEVRGQFIPRPVRMISNMDMAQEQAAMPAVNLAAVNNMGGAIMTYDPVANTISLRHSLFNFNNTFSNSHIHEGGLTVNGPVRTNLGNNATAGGYSSANSYIAGAHDIAFVGDPIALLNGRMYLNYHSTTFGAGQLRGQLTVSNETPSTRLINLAVRGFVGTGEQVLIAGLVVQGAEPVRVLVSAKGPSLSAFGITGTLANPRLALHDSAGRMIATNDDVGTVAAGSELGVIVGSPRNPLESALVVVLPPGNYTAIVSATAGTGVALLEVTDIR